MQDNTASRATISAGDLCIAVPFALRKGDGLSPWIISEVLCHPKRAPMSFRVHTHVIPKRSEESPPSRQCWRI